MVTLFLQLYAEKVATRGLCAIAQCESLRYKLIGGLAVRRYVLSSSLHSVGKVSLLSGKQIIHIHIAVTCVREKVQDLQTYQTIELTSLLYSVADSV